MSDTSKDQKDERVSMETLRLLGEAASQSEFVLPGKSRTELVTILTKTLLVPDSRRRHFEQIELFKRNSSALSNRWPDNAPGEFPIEDLLQNGLGTLSDHQLGLLTMDLSRLNALAELIDESMEEGELGESWWMVMEEIGKGAYPAVKTKTPLLPTSSTNGATSSRPAINPGAYTWFALAASLLIGFGLGALIFHNLGSVERNVLLAASANIANVQPRGTAIAFELQAQSDRPGFATFVLIGGKKPQVFPDYGDEMIQTGEKASIRYGPVEAEPGDLAITIFTETPATEVLRRAASRGELSSRDPESLKKTISELLWKANYRWIAFHASTVPSAK